MIKLKNGEALICLDDLKCVRRSGCELLITYATGLEIRIDYGYDRPNTVTGKSNMDEDIEQIEKEVLK